MYWEVTILKKELVWFKMGHLPGKGSIRIHHECEGGIVKIRPNDHRLASRGLPSDEKQ